MKVYSKPCNQCLYSQNRIVDKERYEEIKQQIKTEQSYFICHKSSIENGKTCCNGFYKKDGQYSQLIRIMERIGGIELVEHKPKDLIKLNR